VRRFNCGEAEWLENRDVDVRTATRYAYGVPLSDIAEAFELDRVECDECGRTEKLVVERFGRTVTVVCQWCSP
jgi:hypothetical protein